MREHIVMADGLKEEFLRSIAKLNPIQLAELLWLADEAIGAAKGILSDIRPSASGDEYVYHGGMSKVELARDAMWYYSGFLIEHGDDTDDDFDTGMA
jgi:hypothetical protein